MVTSSWLGGLSLLLLGLGPSAAWTASRPWPAAPAAVARQAALVRPAVDLAFQEVEAEPLGFEAGPAPSAGGARPPPVVLMHGLLGSSKNWDSWAKAFRATHMVPEQRLIVADLRNHGQSPHDGSMAYPDQAEDVVRLLDTLGEPEAVLVGHSMGGKVAMATAVLHPDRVAKLVVLDISPVRYSTIDGTDWKSSATVVRALYDVPLEKFTKKRDVDQHLSSVIVDPQIRAFALMNLNLDRASGTLSWRIGLDEIVAQLDTLAGTDVGAANVPPFKAPTLFVKGGASRYITDKHTRTIGALFPNFEMETLESAGHWVHVSDPEKLHVCIARFLRGEDGP